MKTLVQVLPDSPPGMIHVCRRESEQPRNLGELAPNTPFGNVAKEMSQSFADASTMKTRSQVFEDIQNFVNDLSSWMKDSMR